MTTHHLKVDTVSIFPTLCVVIDRYENFHWTPSRLLDYYLFSSRLPDGHSWGEIRTNWIDYLRWLERRACLSWSAGLEKSLCRIPRIPAISGFFNLLKVKRGNYHCKNSSRRSGKSSLINIRKAGLDIQWGERIARNCRRSAAHRISWTRVWKMLAHRSQYLKLFFRELQKYLPGTWR